MKTTALVLLFLFCLQVVHGDGPRYVRGTRRSLSDKDASKKGSKENMGVKGSEGVKGSKKPSSKSSKGSKKARGCSKDGFSSSPYKGMDNAQRLLHREGLIDEIPYSLCPKDRNDGESKGSKKGKNVILVVGDGMVRCIDSLMLYRQTDFA
eukprot:scaffold871_cov130-Cylindrotheca_fusiformis.AAC.19